MGFRQLYKEIEEGLPSPVYYIHGKDLFFLTEALNRVRNLIPPEQRDINFLVYDMDTSLESPPPVSEIMDILSTPGFFGTRKIVVIKNIHEARKKQITTLTAHLKDILSRSKSEQWENVLILTSSKPPASELKELLAGKIFSTDRRSQHIKLWVKETAKSLGLTMTERAVDMLVTFSDGESGIIYSEVEKLSLLGKKKIDLDDLYETLYGSPHSSVFNLAEALISKNKKRVFTIYRTIEADTIAILGAINWKYADTAKKTKKDYTEAFQYLLEADRKIKSSSGEYPIEELFLKLLRI